MNSKSCLLFYMPMATVYAVFSRKSGLHLKNLTLENKNCLTRNFQKLLIKYIKLDLFLPENPMLHLIALMLQ